MNSFRRCIPGNSLICRLLQENKTNSVRFLYNDQFLGMDKYVEARQRTISRLGNVKENFFGRMKSQLKNPSPSMIFTEDLKTVIHSCEDIPEDIEMCVQMIKRFHKQNKELRFGTFIFGPVAMRLFYHLKKQDLMNSFLKDPELEGFFDQLKSYYLSMDIFFKNGMYQEIIEAFRVLQGKKIAETMFPREAVVLAAGACYKLNTKETYEMATGFVTQTREARVPVLRKALSFIIALALRQNQPDVALEIVSSVDRFNNITGNNLKLMALASLGGAGRIQDVFDILRRVTDQDAPIQQRVRGEICQETLDTIQQAVDKIGDKEISHIFEQLCRSLKESNSVTSHTIDDLVCMPIEPRAFPINRDAESFPFRQRNRFPETSFRERERDAESRESEFPTRRRRFAGLSDEF